LSNYKLWATIGDGIGSSWRFFRARVDYLHVSNNASHIFFSVVKRTIDVTLTDSPTPRHQVLTINSAFCMSSHTVFSNFPLTTIAMSSVNP
jgi:hypothetical protein